MSKGKAATVTIVQWRNIFLSYLTANRSVDFPIRPSIHGRPDEAVTDVFDYFELIDKSKRRYSFNSRLLLVKHEQ